MRRTEGGVFTPLECINPIANKWRLRWDCKKNESNNFSFIEVDFNYKPTLSQIKEIITSYYNEQINNTILNGFVWRDMSIWLSTENQFNYKAAFDLAIQTQGQSLPVTFKFGTDEQPVYYKFTTIEELTDFYTQSVKFVQETLTDGWEIKDSVNYKLYE